MIGPDSVIDNKDPGDDVQRRFRYQHAYAAIQCAKLLALDSQYEAVYCENFEDVLVKKKNGKFDGVQVKTRQFKGDPFKAGDVEVKKSIGRFAQLEKKFPDQFDTYFFVTNHGFWNEREDKNCISFIIATLKGRGGVKGLPAKNDLRIYVGSICADYGCDEANVVAAILKMEIIGFESDLEKTPNDLRDVVADLNELVGCSAATARRVADNLTHRAFQASSLVLGGEVAALYELVADYAQHREALVLAGKMITAADVLRIIQASLPDTADNLLVSANLVPIDAPPPGMDILTEKLEFGGLQVERINKVKDYKASMEHLYLSWRYKSDVSIANKRLSHLKTLVEDDCVEAKIDSESQKATQFAPIMYQKLRQRLSARVALQTHPLFGATEEHLVGTAGILTEECTVWWSEKFDLKSGGEQ